MADEQVLERFVTEFKFRYDKSALNDIERRIERLESGLKRASAAFAKAGASLLGTQAGLFTAFSKTYERNLAQLASKTGKTFDDIEKEYATHLKKISRDTGRSFGEVADALQKSISAGVEGKRALDLVEQSARSAASGIGIAAEQVSAATTLMEVFGVSARKSLDTITRAAQVGEGETSDYAKGFKETAGLARELGLEIDHIAAGLATASNVAPSLMHASTWLRSFFESMLAPTEDARKRLADLEFVHKSVGPGGDVVERRVREFKDLREIARSDGLIKLLEVFKEIAGDDPELQKRLLGRVEALKFTTSVNVTSLARNLKSIQEGFKGSVDFAFQQQRSWLQFQKMTQAVKEFSFTVGRYVVPPLKLVTDQIHRVRQAFEDLPEGMKVAIGRVIMAGPLLLGVSAVLWGLSKIIRPLSTAMMFFAAKPLMMMAVGVAALAGSFLLLHRYSDRFMGMWSRFKDRVGWGSGVTSASATAQPDIQRDLAATSASGGGAMAGAGMLSRRFPGMGRFRLPARILAAGLIPLGAAAGVVHATDGDRGEGALRSAAGAGAASIQSGWAYYKSIISSYIERLTEERGAWGRQIANAANSALASAGDFLAVPTAFAARLMSGLQSALLTAGINISGTMTQMLFTLFGAWFSYKLIRFTMGRAAKFASGMYISTISSVIANWRAMGGGLAGGPAAPAGFAGIVAQKKPLLIGGLGALAFLAALTPALIAGESAIRGFTTSVVTGLNIAMAAISALGAGVIWAIGRIINNFTGPNADGYISSIASFFGRITRAIIGWTGTITMGAVGAVGHILAPLTDPARMLRFGVSLRNLVVGIVGEVILSLPSLGGALLKVIAAAVYSVAGAVAGGFMAVLGIFLPRVIGNAIANVFSAVGSMLSLVIGPVQMVIRTVGAATNTLMSFMNTITMGMFSGDGSAQSGERPTSNLAMGSSVAGLGALGAGAAAMTWYGKWGAAAKYARTGALAATLLGSGWWGHISRPGMRFSDPLGAKVNPGFGRMAGRAILSPLTWAAPAALSGAWASRKLLGGLMGRGGTGASGAWSKFSGKFPKMSGGLKSFGKDALLGSLLYMLPFGEILSMLPLIWSLGKWGAGTKLGAGLGLGGLGAKMGGLGAAGIMGKLAPLLGMMGPKGWAVGAALAGGYGLYRLGSWLFGGDGDEADQANQAMLGIGAIGSMGAASRPAGMLGRAAGFAGRYGRAARYGAAGIAGIGGLAAGALGMARSGQASGMSIADGVLGAPGDLRLFSDDEAHDRYRHLIPAFGANRETGIRKYNKFIKAINKHDRLRKMRDIRRITADAFGVRREGYRSQGVTDAVNRMDIQQQLGIEGLSMAEMDKYMADTSMWSNVVRGVRVSSERVWQKVKASRIEAGISSDNYAADEKRWQAIRRAGEIKIDKTIAWKTTWDEALRRNRRSYWEGVQKDIIGIAQSITTPLVNAYASVGGWWGKLSKKFAVPSLDPESVWQKRRAANAEKIQQTRQGRKLAALAGVSPGQANYAAYAHSERLAIAELRRNAAAAKEKGNLSTWEFLTNAADAREAALAESGRGMDIPVEKRAAAKAAVGRATSEHGITGKPRKRGGLLNRHLRDAVERLSPDDRARSFTDEERSNINDLLPPTPMPTGDTVGSLGGVMNNVTLNVTVPKGASPDEYASVIHDKIDQVFRDKGRKMSGAVDSNVLA